MPTTISPDELSEDALAQHGDHGSLPPLRVQEYLLCVYFAFVHPFFPVIHKQQFIEEFEQL